MILSGTVTVTHHDEIDMTVRGLVGRAVGCGDGGARPGV